jgi:hypothetical protein
MDNKKPISKNNHHFYPKLHLRKWEEEGATVLNKLTGKKITFNADIDKFFARKKYYSKDGKTDELENRISVFESYIGELIIRIDSSNFEIKLTGKELYLLRLYCLFCSYRHSFTSTVIKEDESGIHQNNNYLFGGNLISDKEDVIPSTERIISTFEKIYKDKNFTYLENFERILNPAEPIYELYGCHLVIFRSESKNICVSDRCAIIETTIDGDYLYTYVPISPSSALAIVKSKYYKDFITYIETKKRFGKNYGSGSPDPYVSIVFDSPINCENLLFCSYYKPYIPYVHISPTLFTKQDYSNNVVNILRIPDYQTDIFNSIFYDDGAKFVYLREEQIINFNKVSRDFRKIILN